MSAILKAPLRFGLFTMAMLACSPALAEAQAHYIANAGVMVVNSDVKVVFDPLFREDFGRYDLPPSDMQQRLLAGEPPFDGIDAIFISHSHDDHVDPGLILEFLQQNEQAQLFAPESAVQAMRGVDAASTEAVSNQVNVVSTHYDAAPVELQIDGLHITAINVPHAGWPGRHEHVENIAFSVTLDAETTVVHLGDADTRVEHFSRNGDFGRSQEHDLALPPFWFFLSEKGSAALADWVDADHAIGVHVPSDMPDDPQNRPLEYQGFDLFTDPGETRQIGEGLR